MILDFQLFELYHILSRGFVAWRDLRRLYSLVPRGFLNVARTRSFGMLPSSRCSKHPETRCFLCRNAVFLSVWCAAEHLTAVCAKAMGKWPFGYLSFTFLLCDQDSSSALMQQTTWILVVLHHSLFPPFFHSDQRIAFAAERLQACCAPNLFYSTSVIWIDISCLLRNT